jgi:hypothetical protein
MPLGDREMYKEIGGWKLLDKNATDTHGKEIGGCER